MAATAGLAMLAGRAHADADATQPRALPAFHAIDIAGTMTVDVVAGKAQSVQLVGDQADFDRVSTTVKNGALVIETKFDGHGNHHIKMIVSVPDLMAARISGTGSMKIAGVANNRFIIDVPGTGDVKIEGSTGELKLDVDGTGSVSAKKLAAKSAKIKIDGTGSASLNVTESVDATVTGTGSVSVIGNPAHVTKHVTGMGSISVR
jgi:hypothetical protein